MTSNDQDIGSRTHGVVNGVEGEMYKKCRIATKEMSTPLREKDLEMKQMQSGETNTSTTYETDFLESMRGSEPRNRQNLKTAELLKMPAAHKFMVNFADTMPEQKISSSVKENPYTQPQPKPMIMPRIGAKTIGIKKSNAKLPPLHHTTSQQAFVPAETLHTSTLTADRSAQQFLLAPSMDENITKNVKLAKNKEIHVKNLNIKRNADGYAPYHTA